MRPAPATLYDSVFLRAWDCRSVAGNAAETWQAVRDGISHVRCDPEWGWLGRAEPGMDLIALAAAAAQAPARALRGDRPPAFACAASKGDIAALAERLRHRIPTPWPAVAPDAPTMALARQLGIRQILPVPVVAACSTGLATLLAGADAIATGQCDEGLLAASDASATPLVLAGFAAMGALCGQRVPGQGSPGFALAEGAAAIALGRTGTWRLLAGVRLGEAAHETRCGDPAVLTAACAALWDACPQPEMIVVHGTGTVAGDAFEAAALAAGPWREIPQIRCKPWIGHCLGASGLVELSAALESPVQRLWKLSLGFGGHLVAVALERSTGSR